MEDSDSTLSAVSPSPTVSSWCSQNGGGCTGLSEQPRATSAPFSSPIVREKVEASRHKEAEKEEARKKKAVEKEEAKKRKETEKEKLRKGSGQPATLK